MIVQYINKLTNKLTSYDFIFQFINDNNLKYWPIKAIAKEKF